MKKIYAVAKGRQTGLFTSWAECEKAVRGFNGAKYKGFADKETAQSWLKEFSAGGTDATDDNAATDEQADYIIYTDGSCLRNPGAGGWAAVVIDGRTGETEELSGGEKLTTNNRMEMFAAVNALALTRTGANIILYTDSQYLKNAFTKYWLKNWKRNGWHTSTGETVKNRELWERLDELVSTRRINFRWVKGHAGNRFNERCDELAKNEAGKF